jgi:hypothetical protein
VTDTPALDWRIQVANPFSPETRPRHHLETARISGRSSKWVQIQDLISRAA